MRQLFILIFIGLMVPMKGFPQEGNFEERLRYIQKDLKERDLRAAIRLTDSLVNVTESAEEEISALILLASLYKESKDFVRAIRKGLLAERKAELSGYYELATQNSIFLAENFREVGLNVEAQRYIEIAHQNQNSIEDTTLFEEERIHIIQEEALQLMNKRDFIAGIKKLEQGKSALSQIKVQTPQTILFNSSFSYLMGQCYLQLLKFEQAINQFDNATRLLGSMESNFRAYMYLGKAEAYLKSEKLDSTIFYLGKAKPYLTKFNRMDFKEPYYLVSGRYYQKINDHKQSNAYFNDYANILKEKTEYSIAVSDELIKDLNNQNLISRKRNLILIWSLLISLAVFSVIYIILKRRLDNNPIRETDQVMEFDMNIEDEPILVPKILMKEINTETDLNISLDTENRLVKDLNQMENEQFYLDKNITLNKLAHKLHSNQKYVSYVIRKYKNQNFNDYILHLRIQFLIRELSENQVMLDYKLSYLAEFSGFSSHSKFTMAFKAVVGIPPSQYIENKRNEIY